jgi:hypothetical protein
MSIFHEPKKEKNKWFENLVNILRREGYKITLDIHKKPCSCGGTMYLVGYAYICKDCSKREVMH